MRCETTGYGRKTIRERNLITGIGRKKYAYERTKEAEIGNKEQEENVEEERSLVLKAGHH